LQPIAVGCDGFSMTSCVYIYFLETAGFKESRKMILIK